MFFHCHAVADPVDEGDGFPSGIYIQQFFACEKYGYDFKMYYVWQIVMTSSNFFIQIT